MKDMNTRLDERAMEELKGRIGEKLLYVGWDLPEDGSNEIFQRVGFVTDGGVYYLDNPVEWRDEYFAGTDCIPALYFRKAKDEEEITKDMGFDNFRYNPVDERILDVWLVQDDLEILKSGAHFQNWASTEGIVLVTDVRQYGFYKNSTWMGEILLVYKGQDVLTKLEPLSKHWDIFGRPMDAVVRRNVVSLSKGSLRPEETARIHGVD